MKLSALVQLQVRDPSTEGLPWLNVDVYDEVAVTNATALSQNTPSRLCLLTKDRSLAARSWTFPNSSNICVRSVFSTWSLVLRAACYESLRWRGNKRRQALVQAYLNLQANTVDEKEATVGTSLRRWARFTSVSFRQSYWNSICLKESRRLLRLRMDKGPNEDHIRQRAYVHQLPGSDGACRPVLLDRLPRSKRVCYLCGVRDDESSFALETLEHMLLKCACPGLVTLRENLRSSLVAIGDTANEMYELESPDFKNDTTLFTAFILGREVGPISLLQAVPPSPATDLLFEPEIARATARWINTITSKWVDRQRGPDYKFSTVDLLPGGQLVNTVVGASLEVFLSHRRAVRSSAEYHERARDPFDVRRARENSQGYVKKKNSSKRPRGSVQKSKPKKKQNMQIQILDAIIISSVNEPPPQPVETSATSMLLSTLP